MPNNFIIGLDLGQSKDYTAMTIIEKLADKSPYHYHLRYLKRFPLGTSYPDIVDEVKGITERPEIGKEFKLTVDKTGVGAPVVDMLKRAGLRPYEIIIHGGEAVTRDGREIRIPKRDLISNLQVLFQSGRLKIAERIPDGQLLVKELLNFKVKISTSGHDSYEAWREGVHDDMVLSVAMAVWAGEKLGDVRVRWV